MEWNGWNGWLDCVGVLPSNPSAMPANVVGTHVVLSVDRDRQRSVAALAMRLLTTGLPLVIASATAFTSSVRRSALKNWVIVSFRCTQ
jgi:hypothetical protein